MPSCKRQDPVNRLPNYGLLSMDRPLSVLVIIHVTSLISSLARADLHSERSSALAKAAA